MKKLVSILYPTQSQAEFTKKVTDFLETIRKLSKQSNNPYQITDVGETTLHRLFSFSNHVPKQLQYDVVMGGKLKRIKVEYQYPDTEPPAIRALDMPGELISLYLAQN